MPRGSLVAILSLTLAACVNTGQGSPPADISQLAWMAGDWVETLENRVTEEMWMEPGEGLMLAVNRTSSDQGASFEYLRIEQRDSGIVYVASPGGGASTDFPMHEFKGQRIVFHRDGEGYPNRLIYELIDASTLRVQIDGGPNSKAKALIWTFSRK